MRIFNNYEYSNDYGSDRASGVFLSGYVQLCTTHTWF